MSFVPKSAWDLRQLYRYDLILSQVLIKYPEKSIVRYANGLNSRFNIELTFRLAFSAQAGTINDSWMFQQSKQAITLISDIIPISYEEVGHVLQSIA